MAKKSSNEENARKDMIARPVSDEELKAITSFEDAMAFVAEQFGSVEDISGVLGNGYSVLEDKRILCGKPFLIVDTRFHQNGSFGPFVTLAVMTKQNERYMVNDGSTGIADQMEQLRDNYGRTAGFLVYGGLKESQYSTCGTCNLGRSENEETCSRCGDTSATRGTGTTFYLDLTAAP